MRFRATIGRVNFQSWNESRTASVTSYSFGRATRKLKHQESKNFDLGSRKCECGLFPELAMTSTRNWLRGRAELTWFNGAIQQFFCYLQSVTWTADE